MYNDSEQISPSEINKYVYCPYQWYYERLYGRKELRERYNKRNEVRGKTDTIMSNFRRGLEYHDNFMSTYRTKRLSTAILILIIIAAVVFLMVVTPFLR